jgi:uncharacterized membrane protein YesL
MKTEQEKINEALEAYKKVIVIKDLIGLFLIGLGALYITEYMWSWESLTLFLGTRIGLFWFHLIIIGILIIFNFNKFKMTYSHTLKGRVS